MVDSELIAEIQNDSVENCKERASTDIEEKIKMFELASAQIVHLNEHFNNCMFTLNQIDKIFSTLIHDYSGFRKQANQKDPFSKITFATINIYKILINKINTDQTKINLIGSIDLKVKLLICQLHNAFIQIREANIEFNKFDELSLGIFPQVIDSTLISFHTLISEMHDCVSNI